MAPTALSTGVALAVASFASASVAAVAAGADLHLLDASAFPNGLCLDGTPGGFYFRQASSSENETKWVFSLEGGGECVTQSDCDARKLNSLGSSKFFAPTAQLGQLQEALPQYNPDFHSWNQVFIKYCSGDLHMGQQTAQGQSLKGLQFSGHHILDGVLHTLLGGDFGLSKADTVIWSGDSAGGLGATDSVDWVLDFLRNSTEDQFTNGALFGAPIGGFYYSNNWPYNGTSPPPVNYIPWSYDAMKQYYSLWDAFVPERCAAGELADTPWECMMANGSYSTIESPIFFVEAQTDEVVMPLHNGLPALWDNHPPQCNDTVTNCPKDVVDYMESWSSHMVGSLQQLIVADSKGRNAKDGLFNPACLIHCSFSWEKPLIAGKNYLQAIGDWVFQRDGSHNSANRHQDNPRPHVFTDSCGVMCNPSCSGN